MGELVEDGQGPPPGTTGAVVVSGGLGVAEVGERVGLAVAVAEARSA